MPGTWYPPSEAATLLALRLAAEHGNPDDAIHHARDELTRLRNYPAARAQLERALGILEHWHHDATCHEPLQNGICPHHGHTENRAPTEDGWICTKVRA